MVEEETIVETPALITARVPEEEVPKERKIIFQPNPGPQTEFLQAPEREVLYGGAAGGGKSFALTVDPVRDFDNPNFRGLIIRKTTEELRELVSISKHLYPQINKDYRFSERDKTWYFPKGGSLWMSYLDRDDDVGRYQGQAYSWIGFDELTHWSTPYAWDSLRSRLRTSKDSGLSLYMRATTNPGSAGHSWVKKMFIDPAPPNTAFWATDIDSGEIMKWPDTGEPLFKRRFIPANLYDNPYLAEDRMYEANLLSLPEQQRKKLLEGNWDVAEGAAFTEWDRRVHVIEPFHIPRNWPRFRAADYGYSQHTAVLWFAVAPDNQLVVYRELYTKGVTASDLADVILEMEADEHIKYGVLDSSLWANRGDLGPSLAETMIAKGCKWRKADRSKGSRVAGKNELHRRLQIDPYTDKPGIVFFNTCFNTIAQLPLLPLDKNNPEDVDTTAEDHGYDALRYGIMTRPKAKTFDFGAVKARAYRPVDKVFGY